MKARKIAETAKSEKEELGIKKEDAAKRMNEEAQLKSEG